MIIKTSADILYFVVEPADEHLAHCWNGLRVKHTNNGFFVAKNAKPELVRKAGSKIVDSFASLKGAM
jgi:hypothetical protein